MATTSYRIDRYNKDENDIVRTMVEVEGAQKDFSRLNPFSAERRRLLREVRSILKADADEIEAQHERERNAMDPSERAVFESLDDLAHITYSPESSAARVRRSCGKYGNPTLRAIIDRFGNGCFDGATALLVRYEGHEESFLREVIIFDEVLDEEHPSTAADILNDVRLCQRRFRRQDLTELGTEDRTHVKALVTVALELNQNYTELENAAISSMTGHMPSLLSDVVCKYAHRTQDIIDYIQLHHMTAAKIDPQHLTEYLENPTRSLGAGVL